jgi:uncharacterized membrane protein YdbT with pleckstrin-like domain
MMVILLNLITLYNMLIDQVISRKQYEEIKYLLRRHPVTFIPQIIFLFVLMLAPIALFFIFNYMLPTIFANEIFYPFIVIVLGSFYLISYLVFFIHFIDYYLDIWIVTNDRIIDIEQFGLFSRTISELDLFRIQDVTSEVHGFFATMFDFGDLHIKTASSNIDIVFRNIRNPNLVREHLIKLSDLDRKHHYNDEKLSNT